VVLIIDEAQNLDPKLLEEVRLLTNLETPKGKLLQVILMGQPELDHILSLPQFRQLKQRVSLRYQLKPLNSEDTNFCIMRRLKLAGAAEQTFTPKLKEIYRYSKGIPRLINIVCDNALLTGFATDQKVIGDKIIREVVSNLDGRDFQKSQRTFHLYFAIFLGCIAFGMWVILWNGLLSDLMWDLVKWAQTFISALKTIKSLEKGLKSIF
jgi:general secretion pathway protein A